MYEAFQSLPFVKRLDYASWSLVQYDTSLPALRQAFTKLASMSDEEFRRRQLAMQQTIKQLTMKACMGRPGLHHLLAALEEDRSDLADIRGHGFLNIPQVNEM